TADADCSAGGKYCKSTTPPACTARIAANSACDPDTGASGNCAFASCLQCTNGGGASVCPASPQTCPCSADSECPTNSYCDIGGTNQCRSCTTASAPCGGGRHCNDGNCGTDKYCGS